MMRAELGCEGASALGQLVKPGGWIRHADSHRGQGNQSNPSNLIRFKNGGSPIRQGSDLTPALTRQGALDLQGRIGVFDHAETDDRDPVVAFQCGHPAEQG